MARLLVLRILGAVALCSLALILVGLAPLPGAAPAGAGVISRTPTITVNRFRKGDRLPLLPSETLRRDGASQRLESRQRVPVGCDPAFSPVSAPSLSMVYGRCTV
jgi:hypothetical protein